MQYFFQNSSVLVFIIMIWVLPWKGYALWTAAKRGKKVWFVALLLVNTLAILDIFYIFVIAKKTGKDLLADINKD
jgi:hypothetical protein